MVQRKVLNKLSGGSSLKSSSFQHQHQDNIKNRGADMKKKIKKSRSIKHSDMEFLKKREKIPHVHPEQKSPEKTKTKKSESTPNYMKSTSSSDAKKDNSQSKSQVSFRNLLPPVIFDNGKKSCSKRNSISNSKSNSSEAAVQQKLKPVRTLTKTTSFKPSRNKCSPLVLTETLDFKRKTCSSILKDSKFPGYLTLDPGGSETEGTSAIHVCPYTYCSLNGHHHHHPLPPLKSFISARRRMLKTQRSIKLGCLSPRRSSKSKNNNNEAIIEEVKAESASNNSMDTPVVINQHEHNDFFIDIYSKENDTTIGDSDENGDIMEGKQYSQEVYQEEEAAEESGDDDFESGNSDMDWEGRKYSTLYLDDVDYESSVKYESSVIHQESILKSDEASELKSFDEESISSNGDFLQHFQGSVNQSYDQDQLMAVNAINGEIKNSNSMESFKQNLNNQVKDASVQTEIEDDSYADVLKTSHLDCAKSRTENEECSRNNVNNFYQCDARIIVNCINLLQHLSGNVPPKKMDSDSETNCFKVNAAVKEKAPFTANITIEIILTLQQDSTEKKHRDAMEKDEKTNQPEVNSIDFFPDDTQCNTSESEEKLNEELNITSHDSDSTDSADQSHSAVTEITLDDADQELKKIDMDTTSSSGAQDDSSMETTEGNSNCRINKRKISTEEQEGTGEFNPRAPNFLPLEPEEKPEKVDLRHQMMDDRRNTEEWMIDYALQKTLTKLAPARKKKVALLVEAFEKVMPIIPRCDLQIRHSSSSSSSVESPRPIQACS